MDKVEYIIKLINSLKVNGNEIIIKFYLVLKITQL
jgi:hypothetical protein